MDLKQLKELMRAIRQLDIAELEIKRGEESVRLRRETTISQASRPVLGSSVLPPDTSSLPPTSSPKVATKEDPSIAYITSPFVGTFYAAPAPDAPAFVEVNHDFKAGEVLCIVEAMKLMNEIEADCDGTLLEVLADNGKPVEYGDKLFRFRKR
ncbi:MAG: acetyl-CoA carboxylase biotin carboxyl carrier protein [Myxococcales bacterium]|nr:acetyl-CoA carboxylase biotin carboxyl carrier protein [Myxococcales bacterium]